MLRDQLLGNVPHGIGETSFAIEARVVSGLSVSMSFQMLVLIWPALMIRLVSNFFGRSIRDFDETRTNE